ISALLMSVKPLKEMDEKSFERIEISAKRISDIYKDLTYLLLKNSESDKRTAKKMLLNETLKSQIVHLTPLAEKKKITLVEQYDADIYVMIDEESLIRLLNNLLSNAIKYNRIGGKIEVSTTMDTLMIKDSGIGIDQKYQKEIYKRFYRATNESGGFGLGLNIVYKICQFYDIEIEMESEKGKGTVFQLKF
nr:HAMP domain-containing histidine kinase [Campylobacterota bacterium]